MNMNHNFIFELKSIRDVDLFQVQQKYAIQFWSQRPLWTYKDYVKMKDV